MVGVQPVVLALRMEFLMTKINLSLPGLYQLYFLNRVFIETLEQHPERLNEDVKIDSVYGTPSCKWNGGRAIDRNDLDNLNEEKFLEIINFYNKRNIRIRLTFTNLLVNEELLDDPKGNRILQLVFENTTTADVNVGTTLLKEYIENKYPGHFNFVYSTTLRIKNVDEINEITKKDMIVPDYSINNNFEILERLSNPDKIELLANESCVENCPVRKRHYLSTSKFNIGETDEIMSCRFFIHENYYETVHNRKHYISLQKIRDEYLPLGFSNFKINGRGQYFLNALEGYLEYLIKPEYINLMRYDVTRSIVENGRYLEV